MHGTEGAQRHVVFDGDVTGKRGGISQDAVAADLAVVANMGASHDQAVGADTRNTASARRAAADGHAFANGIVIAEDRFRRLAAIFQVLRGDPDRAEGIENVSCADSRSEE